VWLVNVSYVSEANRTAWSLGNLGAGLGFIAWSLVVDVVLSLFVVAIAGWMFQRWRGRHVSLLRYRLRTLLAVVTVSALIMAPIATWHQQQAAEQRVIEGLKPECVSAKFPLEPTLASVHVTTVWMPPDWLPDSLATVSGFRQLFDRIDSIGLRGDRFTAPTLELLDALPYLSSLAIAGEVNGDAFRCVCGPVKLRRLSISKAGITDRDIERLPSLSRLEELDLGNTELTDSAFGTIARLTNLRHLTLQGNRITGVGLGRLTSLPNLSELNLVGDELTDEGIATIKDFPSLKKLSLFGSSLRHARLQCTVSQIDFTCNKDQLDLNLQSVPALEHLSVRRTGLGSGHQTNPIVNLGNVDSLSGLFLEGVSLDAASLSAITNASALTQLALDHVVLAGSERIDLRALTALHQIRYLSLKGGRLVDDDLNALDSLGKLESLDLSGCNISGKCLVQLQRLPMLTTLWLSQTPVSDESVSALKAALPTLRTVYFEPKTPVLQVLRQQVALVRNRLAKSIECKLNPWKLADDDFACLEGLENLDILDLSDTHLTDAGLEHLKRLPKLRELIVRGTQLTDAAVRTLKQMPALVHVDIEGTRITAEGRRALGILAKKTDIERN
jgi:Leucine-rich repeat (LRR) protein